MAGWVYDFDRRLFYLPCLAHCEDPHALLTYVPFGEGGYITSSTKTADVRCLVSECLERFGKGSDLPFFRSRVAGLGCYTRASQHDDDDVVYAGSR